MWKYSSNAILHPSPFLLLFLSICKYITIKMMFYAISDGYI